MFCFKIAPSCCLWLAFFHFESKIYCSALPCLFSVYYFIRENSGVAERSFLGEARHHISSLALCLVQIALKLDAFASPHSLGLNPVRVAPHPTSKLLVLRHKPICITVSLCKHACKEVCDVKPGLGPCPLLARPWNRWWLDFITFIANKKVKIMFRKAKCISNRCKDLFKRKKYFGFRCTLKYERHLK